MKIGGLQLDAYDAGIDVFRQERDSLEQCGLLDTELLSVEKVAELPDHRFGLVGMTKNGELVRRFPLHDDGNTKLSAFFFARNRAKLPSALAEKVALRIHAACQEHGVLSPIDGATVSPADIMAAVRSGPFDLEEAEGHFPAPKTAAAEDDYAVVIEKKGEKVGLYYVGNRDAIVEAAERFCDDGWRELTPELRVKVSESLVERLRGEQLPVPEKVAAYAAETLSPVLEHWLDARRALVPSTSHKALDEMWEKRASFGGRDLGRTLEVFDRMHGVHEHWDHGILDPFLSCYASPPPGSIKVGEQTVPEGDVRRLIFDTKKLASFMDLRTIATLQQNPISGFQALPRPTQEFLLEQM